jgi:hypothetical protein
MAKGPVAALELQPSELAVYTAASRFFAALLGAGRVSDENQAAVMRYCIESALRMALETDRLVQSDGEATGEGKREHAGWSL